MLIVFALTHDKLIVDIDKSTFNLIIQILNSNESNSNSEDVTVLADDHDDGLDKSGDNNDNGQQQHSNNEQHAYLDDLATLLNCDTQFQSPGSTRNVTPTKSTATTATTTTKYSSATSSLTSSPTSMAANSQSSSHRDEAANNCFDADDNDELVYRKIYSKCRKIYDKLTRGGAVKNETTTSFSPITLETNFNARLLALDCLLNFNANMKKNLLGNDYFRTELRESATMDKVLWRLELLLSNIIKTDASRLKKPAVVTSTGDSIDQVICYLLAKFKSCVNLLETLTQSNSYAATKKPVGSSLSSATPNGNSRLLSITNVPNADLKEPVYTANQNYLIDFGPKKSFLLNLFTRY
jgi:hypothetical protein